LVVRVLSEEFEGHEAVVGFFGEPEHRFRLYSVYRDGGVEWGNSAGEWGLHPSERTRRGPGLPLGAKAGREVSWRVVPQ
jgi:hypothetical protein